MPLEAAGTEIQCPHCGLLNDVPKMGELEQISPDGTYGLNPAIPPTNPRQLEEMVLAYSRDKMDAAGQPIDLRYSEKPANTPETIPLASEPERVAPHYDPETGELIKPLELQPDPDLGENPAAIPVAKRVLQYGTNSTAPPRLRPVTAIRSLLHPINILVMFFVLLIHCFIAAILSIPIPGREYLALPFAGVAAFLMIAHYGTVIEEIGPLERDELPRFLRDLSPSEDLWRPFANVMLAILLCYGLTIFAFRLPIAPAPRWRIALGLAALGTFLLPATLLTSTTSGTFLNLRPDRPWRMIGIIGMRYFLVVGILAAAVVVYAAGLLMTVGNAVFLFASTSRTPKIFRAILAYPTLIAGIFLLHYFCWTLGLVYRGWHREFPWVLQFHQRRPPPVLPSGPPAR
ncbi:MAG: hypothetical protein ABSF29_06785 [Tepidisphaeraceae bacterium]